MFYVKAYYEPVQWWNKILYFSQEYVFIFTIQILNILKTYTPEYFLIFTIWILNILKTYALKVEMSDGGERKMLKIAFLNMKQ